ncbi:hypothetical protein [Pseudomonas sp. RIT623]|uniref:hypothetical protein n=1 Tax=Pseudomonas sp. RIT623 TaxID=2559075 RepID=UPI00106FE575|nr:hypothetical protein [Pseudomonas sp. RIT623]TFF41666.1 hypothetical protein E3U47_07915 [Pseudomonas sp. RIT623]
MTITQNEAAALVRQVQGAHRLLAGYYGRLLMTLDSLAAKFGANFWYWNPIDFDRPCRSYTSPTSKWSWDFLPLLNANLVYTRTDDIQQVAIQFRVLTDPSLLKENRRGNNQPDPVSLATSTPLLRIYAYRLKDGSPQAIKDAWDDMSYPKSEPLEVCELSEHVSCIWWESDLGDFIVSTQDTLLKLTSFIAQPQIHDGQDG